MSGASEKRFTFGEFVALVGWTSIKRHLAVNPCGAMGRSEMSAACDVSDVKLAIATDDRTSVRRISDFARTEPTPKRIAFVRAEIAENLERSRTGLMPA